MQGSDLHFYRGHLKCPPNFICGHEFVGEIVEKGSAVKSFEIGDKVVVPFFTACQECYYCVRGQASRCAKGELFGNSVPANTVDGGQAEYVRVPLAETTFVKTPKGMEHLENAVARYGVLTGTSQASRKKCSSSWQTFFPPATSQHLDS
jgi:threonine dehydrogenase-like Zn-dependent dehydrogenase